MINGRFSTLSTQWATFTSFVIYLVAGQQVRSMTGATEFPHAFLPCLLAYLSQGLPSGSATGLGRVEFDRNLIILSQQSRLPVFDLWDETLG